MFFGFLRAHVLKIWISCCMGFKGLHVMAKIQKWSMWLHAVFGEFWQLCVCIIFWATLYKKKVYHWYTWVSKNLLIQLSLKSLFFFNSNPCLIHCHGFLLFWGTICHIQLSILRGLVSRDKCAYFFKVFLLKFCWIR